MDEVFPLEVYYYICDWLDYYSYTAFSQCSKQHLAITRRIERNLESQRESFIQGFYNKDAELIIKGKTSVINGGTVVDGKLTIIMRHRNEENIHSGYVWRGEHAFLKTNKFVSKTSRVLNSRFITAINHSNYLIHKYIGPFLPIDEKSVRLLAYSIPLERRTIVVTRDISKLIK